MAHKKPSDAGYWLKVVACRPFSRADPSVVAELAKALWHDLNAPEQANNVLQSGIQRPLHKRRALYLIDLFRRFSCVTDAQYQNLTQIVNDGRSALSDAELVPPHGKGTRAVAKLSVTGDQVALAWGLREDLNARLGDVLQYQTRHYTASLYTQSRSSNS